MTNVARQFGILGALFSGLAVAAGAFGAHGLRDIIPAERLGNWETAAHYQMYHGLALLLIAALADRLSAAQARWAGLMFTFGILIFSGSLYLLVVTGLRFLGAITPIGGVLMIGGWLMLVFAFVRQPLGDSTGR